MIISFARPQASVGLDPMAPPPGFKADRSAPPDEVVLSPASAEAAEAPRKIRKTAAVLAGLGLVGTMTGVIGGLLPVPAAAIHCASGEITGQGREAVLRCENVISPGSLQQPQNRAQYAFESLREELGPLTNLNEYQGRKFVTAWPLGQVLQASLDNAKLTGDYTDFNTLAHQLESYKSPEGGYAPGSLGLRGHGDRYFDDNAWIGLVFIQAHQQTGDPAYLQKAEAIFAFMKTGIQPDGGILWKENSPSPSYNTCSFGPSIELALRLYQATGNESYRETAQKLTDVMDARLREPGGLYADNYNLQSGHLDKTHFSYNQGTPIGAHLLWYRITGDEHHLELARQTADASLREMDLWSGSPAFNAVYLRNLIQLGPEYRHVLDDYAHRAWNEGMDSATGLFKEGGMGRYEGKPGKMSTIDQAGMVQIYALQAWPAQDLNQVS